MEIVRSVIIARSAEDVFDFVADARNDPSWCPKVLSTELCEGDVPDVGGVYVVVHKPIPGRPSRQMTMDCRQCERPNRLQWHEEDGSDVLDVTYTLDALGASTRFTQCSVADLGAPRLLAPIMRHGIGRDIARQLRKLKAVLEGERPPARG